MCELTLYVEQFCNLPLWSLPNINQFLVIPFWEAKQNKKTRPNDMRRIHTKPLHYSKLLSGEIACLTLYQFQLSQTGEVLLCLTLS